MTTSPHNRILCKDVFGGEEIYSPMVFPFAPIRSLVRPERVHSLFCSSSHPWTNPSLKKTATLLLAANVWIKLKFFTLVQKLSSFGASGLYCEF